MQGTIIHQLNNGRLISLPIPIFGVAYATYEDEVGLVAFFAMKLPGHESAQDVLARAKKAAPGLTWQLYLCAETGGSEGSPSAFQRYQLKKEGDRLVLDVDGVGDMVSAFHQIGREQGPTAVPTPDINAVLDALLGKEPAKLP